MRFRTSILNPVGSKLKKKIFYKNNQLTVSRHNGTKVCLRRKKSKFKTKINFSFSITQNLHGIIQNISLARRHKTFVGVIRYSNGAMSCLPLFCGAFLNQIIYTCSHLYVPKCNYIHKFCAGTTTPMVYVPVLSCFFNILSSSNQNSWFCHSAGTFMILKRINIERGFGIIRLPTNSIYVVHETSYVTLGRNSNTLPSSIWHGKAGKNVNKGFRPVVRGVAKNPVDHPHGGRTKSNSPEKTPWGRIAKFNK